MKYKKIMNKYLKIILFLLALFLIFIALLILSIEFFNNIILNVIAVVLMFSSLILIIVLLIKIYPISVTAALIKSQIKLLKKKKKYYYGTIETKDADSYLSIITNRLQSNYYKDYSKVLNTNEENFLFYFKKHYHKLDSTCHHFSIGMLDMNVDSIKEFYHKIDSFEQNLTKRKYWGQYQACIAICIVKNFEENPQILELMNNSSMVNNAFIVRVLIDIDNNRIYISEHRAFSINRAIRLIGKYIFNKKFKNCLGEEEDNTKMIDKLQKNLSELDFTKISDLTLEQNDYLSEMLDDSFLFVKEKDPEDGAYILYKEKDRSLIVYCDYSAENDSYGLINIGKLRFANGKKVKKEQNQEIITNMKNYLKLNNIKYQVVVVMFNDANQTLVEYRIDD